jgi:mRNA interferase MazF
MVKQGNIIWLNFDPQAGHEQKGRRPALVVSNDIFNRFCRMAVVCPITHTDKEHPFHVKLDNRTNTDGVILCDQLRALDIIARNAEYIETLPVDLFKKVKKLIINFY